MFSPYVDALLESVFLLAFYAWLRSGEFTTASQAFDSDRDVSYSDLVFHPHYYSLRLRHSKRGGPCSVIVARIDSSFCPFRAMVKYIRIRPITAPLSPLFITSGNLPLTKNWFCSHLRQVLIKSNLSPQNYSGHSFRIGCYVCRQSRLFPCLLATTGTVVLLRLLILYPAGRRLSSRKSKIFKAMNW